MTTKTTVISSLCLSIFLSVSVPLAMAAEVMTNTHGANLGKIISISITSTCLIGLITYAFIAFFGYRKEYDL
jgi:ABC-type tungstate transport system substrate-binding protein